MPEPHDVTQLLGRWADGDQQALEDLTPLVYAELRQLAASYLRGERPDHTLQPTALVHEAYLRLVAQQNLSLRSRSHFFGAAARLMREILVDHARRRHAGKRAGKNVSLEEAVSMPGKRSADLIMLDGALNALENFDPRKAKGVELRFFGGLSMDEIAQTLEISAVTVRRDLRLAEAWLYRQMRSG